MILGTMCGTSMDSLDVVVLEFKADNFNLLAAKSYDLPAEYKPRYLNIIENSGNTNLQELGELDAWTGEVYGKLINQFISDFKLKTSSILAIANHGQTIWHAPNGATPFTMQIGDSYRIAEATGVTVIGDFRSADLAAQGQGAPIAPVFHQQVFADANKPRTIVNIGGMANISVLQDGEYVGFDSGPGNCLLDYWVQQNFEQAYDKDGLLAKQGKVISKLLDNMLADPYFKQPAPKSTGREYFNSHWLDSQLAAIQQELDSLDVLATLVALTAYAISDSIKQYAKPGTEVYLCGGGASNPEIKSSLSKLLEKPVYTTEALGVSPDWVEAIMFGWLAYKRINNQALDLSKVTGSKHPVLLGAVYAV